MAILLLNGLNSQIRMEVSAENTPDLSFQKHSRSFVRYHQSHSQTLIYILEIFQKMPHWTILGKSQILVLNRVVNKLSIEQGKWMLICQDWRDMFSSRKYPKTLIKCQF